MAKIRVSGPVDSYTFSLTAWHNRVARKMGDGNASEGVRLALEKLSQEFVDRRRGPKDRRKRRK